MTTIDELLGDLGIDDSESEKTASGATPTTPETDIEKQARELGLIGDNNTNSEKTASNSEGEETMNLDLDGYYNQLFGEDSGEVKTASEANAQAVGTAAPTSDLAKVAEALEQAGEIAGESFSYSLNERLLDYTIKIAQDGKPDSAATQAAQAGAAVLGGSTGNPQLPVNRREDAAKPMDTEEDFYDLKDMDGATTKARIEAALASNNVEGLSHTNKNVATGLERPASQNA